MSAFAFLMFFVSYWVFSIVYFFFFKPYMLTIFSFEYYKQIQIPEANQIASIFTAITDFLPLLVLIFLIIGWLKYSAEVKRY